MEGVYPVENVVGGGGGDKSGCVGYILMNLELVSEEEGDSEIDE